MKPTTRTSDIQSAPIPSANWQIKLCVNEARPLMSYTRDRYPFTIDTHETFGPMHWSHHLHYLPYFLRSIPTISALSFHQTAGMTTGVSPTLTFTHASNETSQTNDFDYQCTQEDSPSRNLPLYRDCYHILDHIMPPSDTPHEFYRSTYQNDQDPYQLPYQAHFRTCAIVVDFVPGYTTETSSWLTIRAMTMGLTKWCVHEGPGLGGSVRMGIDYKMSISVLGSLRETVEGNKTTS